MNTLASLLTEVGGWLTSAGIFGLFLTLSYREWSAWRTRAKEREAIVFLLVNEIRGNDGVLESMVKLPATITSVPIETLQFKVWEDTRLRLAQLLRREEEFQKVLDHYQSLESLRNIINSPVMSDDNKQSLVSLNIEYAREDGQAAVSMLGQYAELPEPGYSVWVTVRD
jgi:hypothetical protein